MEGLRSTKCKKATKLAYIVWFYCSLLIFIPILSVSIYFLSYSFHSTNENIQMDVENYRDSTINMISTNLGFLEDTYYSLISDPVINPHIYSEPGTDTSYSPESVTSRLQKITFFNTAWREDLLTFLSIYISPAQYYYTEQLYTSLPHSKNIGSNPYHIYVHPFLCEMLEKYQNDIAQKRRIRFITVTEENPEIIYYIRDYTDIITTDFCGLVVLGINSAQLGETYNSLNKYDDALGILYNEENTVLASNQSEYIGTKLSDAQYQGETLEHIFSHTDYMVYQTDLEDSGLKSALMIPKHSAYADLYHTILLFSLMIVAIFSLYLFILWRSFRKIHDYISQMNQSFTNISEEHYVIDIPLCGILEFDAIRTHILQMAEKLKHLISTVYNNKILLKEAELKALQNQINPHFLFNILLCISWKAKACRQEELSRMIDALSEFMNGNIIRSDRQTVPLQDELKTSEYYLYLQQIRFGKKLSYHIEVETPDLLKYQVPKLILQPLVENAVVHGIEPKLEKGEVHIRIFQEKEEIVILVSDNGVGFSIKDLQKEPDRAHHKIGLHNTSKRIQYFYGEQYSLQYKSTPQQGTTAIIRIPAKTKGTGEK